MVQLGRRFFRALVWVLAAAFIATSSPASLERRVALVIGNGAYEDAPLRNPANDATDVAEALDELGFEVVRLLDADQQAMEEAITGFAGKLGDEHTVGLFYFAGHGIELDGQNYLVPVSVSIGSEADVKYKTVNAGYVLDGMTRAGNGLNLMVLDARSIDTPWPKPCTTGAGGSIRFAFPTSTRISPKYSRREERADRDDPRGQTARCFSFSLTAGSPGSFATS